MYLNIDNVIKFLTVFLCVMYKLLLATNLLNTNNILVYIIILLFFIVSVLSLRQRKMYKKDFWKLILIMGLGVLSIIKVGSVNYIFPILIAMVYYNKDKKEKSILELLKNFYLCLCIGVSAVILLNLLGFLPSYNLIRYVDNGIKIRYSMGFSHPNFLGIYSTFIILNYFALKKPNFKNIVFTVFITFVVYQICGSRTSVICNLLFVFMLLLKQVKVFKSIYTKSYPHLFVILTGFTIFSTTIYSVYKLNVIDKIFSGRLSIYHEIINEYNLLKLPFGSPVYENIILDNYYLAIFLYFGVFGYILWVIFYYITSQGIVKNVMFTIIQITILVYGLSETNVIVSSINFMLSVQLLFVLYGNKEKKL